MALKPISVKQLNGYIKKVLATDPILGNVAVKGEISNLKFHGSGHVYFNLKDEYSKINCFLPENIFRSLNFDITEGMAVTVFGYISLYEKGGSYSLNIRELTVEGTGELSAAFEQLKAKLDREGLFDPAYKKQLPVFPHKVAVITSETGAAIQDILKILTGRNNYTDVIIYPTLVQGPNAAGEISEGIKTVNNMMPEVDCIIVGRGGGSIEELWAFNEEIVARSIFESEIPIISAVGHETDFTIADFVADVRAETPTAAAQIAVPDISELLSELEYYKENLSNSVQRKINNDEMRLELNKMEALKNKLLHRIDGELGKINIYRENMKSSVENTMSQKENRVDVKYAELEALNPKNIMDRGYAALIDQNGILINTITRTTKGDKIKSVLKDGILDLTVDDVKDN